MKQPRFSGTGVALVTPFKKGKVDFEALERVTEHVIQGGVDFLVALGTTGEAITLSDRESREVLDRILRVNNGRLPIVAGPFGESNTARLVEKVRAFNLDGFDAIMSSSPAYNKPNQEGIYQHFMALAEASPLPVIIYNVPSRTGRNVQADTVIRLANASNKFIAVKEAAGDMAQAMRLLKYRPEHLLVLSGDDPLTLPIIACGGDGVISVIANAMPKEWADMARAALQGDLVTARRLNSLMLDIHPWLYIDGNPSGVKGLMEYLGLCSKEVRLPMSPISDANLQSLIREVEKGSR
ncbi:MAG: 4-hydroxy-tetrahydrodipicolinate synthase [Saprospirales bacterium]|nr:4-hydroxy-tetrahydrodipicolinate synthase [Saprospirales bacterium]